MTAFLKRVFDVIYHLAVEDFDDIKATWAVIFVSDQIERSDLAKFVLFMRVNRLNRSAKLERRTAFDLDKNKGLFVHGDNVDFADLVSVIALQNFEVLFP